jgi:DNA-binding NarL/FixJ family response regulator
MQSENRWTVMLADDHEHILNKASEILANEFTIVARLSDGKEVAQTAAKLKPDIMVLDICMPNVGGLAAVQEVRRLGLPVKVVFLTVSEDADCVQMAVTMGASYVLKRRMHIDLPAAIKETLAGRVFVSPLMTAPIAS